MAQVRWALWENLESGHKMVQNRSPEAKNPYSWVFWHEDFSFDTPGKPKITRMAPQVASRWPSRAQLGPSWRNLAPILGPSSPELRQKSTPHRARNLKKRPQTFRKPPVASENDASQASVDSKTPLRRDRDTVALSLTTETRNRVSARGTAGVLNFDQKTTF